MSRAFQIAMDSAQEVGTGSTSTATGLGVAVFDDSGVNPTLEYTIEVRGLDWGPFTTNPAQTAPLPDNVVDAHFHQAATGVNGPVRFGWKTHDLDDFAAGNQHLEGAVPVATVHGVWETTDTVSIAGFVASFSGVALGNPTDMYANIHSSAFPGGDIRSQLICIATDSGETVNGTAGRDILPGLGGNDTVLGLGGDDTLDGGAGDDTVKGGTENDTMAGGLGNDFLFVDAALDVVNETAGEGVNDRVFASVSYALTAGSEIENFSTDNHVGTDAIDLTGNELNNLIYGNAGNNRLDGLGGADILVGFGGDDEFVVDSALDLVNESAGAGPFAGGDDHVFASVSYMLRPGRSIERLSTTDAAAATAINLTGNEIVNLITGNAGANRLDGGGGADTLTGLGGNDFYFVDDLADAVVEAAGDVGDRVFASTSYNLGAGVSVENLSTTNHAGAGAINLSGNELANFVTGNAGSNTLNGGAGKDMLAGFGGSDNFLFDTALNTAPTANYAGLAATANVDRITDFDVANDLIHLDDAIFGAIGGTLDAGEFATGAAASTATHFIIYNNTTGQLLYDADGSNAGAAFQFALLTTGLALSNADFVVV